MNLIVPLMYGLLETREHGFVGMLVGSLILLLGGFWCCFRFKDFSKALIVGGWIVALSQVYPLLQMLAGIFGMGVANAVGPSPDEEYSPYSIHSEPAGCVATIMTGAILIGVSALIGLFVRAITPRRLWKWADGKNDGTD
jgi:hypothetical protein